MSITLFKSKSIGLLRNDSCSSAFRFLTGSESGPFLRREWAHLQQTITCTQVLLSGLILFNNPFNDHEKSLRAVRGVHGLHIYANEFWIEHLLNLAEAHTSCNSVEVASVLNVVDQLCMRLTSPEAASLPTDAFEEALDQRLAMLKQRQVIYWTVQHQLLKRKLAQSGESDTG